MKKQKIQLIVILVIFVICIGGYFGLKTYNEKAAAKESEPEYTALALSEEDEVTALKVSNENGNFELTKNEDGTWILKSDETVNIDQDTVDSMVELVSTITSDKVVDGADSLSDYGLDEPSITIEITLSDGSAHNIILGDYNSAAYTYYLMVDDISTIYTVTSSINSKFTFTVDDITAEETESTEESENSEQTESTEEGDISQEAESTEDIAE